MCIDLGRPPDEAATLASVCVVRNLGKVSLVNVPFAAHWAMQDHRDAVVPVKLAGFEHEGAHPTLPRYAMVGVSASKRAARAPKVQGKPFSCSR
jgi:hypothetical protein